MSRSIAHPPSPGLLYLVFVLVLASVVPWRTGTLYGGGLDPIVVGKAIVGVIALVLVLTQRPTLNLAVGARSCAIVLAITAVGLIGALASGEIASSIVLAARLLLLVLTIVTVVRRWPARTILTTLLAASATIGLVAAASGLAVGLSSSRLAGIIPPLSPNEIALLIGMPLVALVHELVRGRSRPPQLAAIVALAGVLFATGSRTALIATVIACVLMLFSVRRLPRRSAMVLLGLVPVIYAVAAYTDFFGQVLARGEAPERLATLNSRTIAWQAVLQTPGNTWERWWGAGLSTKRVTVQGQYWDSQVLDSSWISALAQVGVIGVVLVGIWAAMTLVSSIRGRVLDGVIFPLVAFLLVRSTLESGLVESSSAFVLFFTLALLVEPVTRGVRAIQAPVPIPMGVST